MIRFTQANKCNDPFEIKPLVSAIERQSIVHEQLTARIFNGLPELLKDYPEPFRTLMLEMDKSGDLENLKRDGVRMALNLLKSATPGILDRVAEECGRQLGILSLTEDPLSPPMWAHYAGNHQGLVFEFDPHHPWFHGKRNENDELCHLRKVQYVDTLHTDYLVDLDGWDLCYRKLKEWGYECEWRIVRPLYEANRKINEDIHLFSVPPDALTCVIFGWRASGAVKRSVRTLKLENPSLTHLVLKQADLSTTDGRMLVSDISDEYYPE